MIYEMVSPEISYFILTKSLEGPWGQVSLTPITEKGPNSGPLEKVT